MLLLDDALLIGRNMSPHLSSLYTAWSCTEIYVRKMEHWSQTGFWPTHHRDLEGSTEFGLEPRGYSGQLTEATSMHDQGETPRRGDRKKIDAVNQNRDYDRLTVVSSRRTCRFSKSCGSPFYWEPEPWPPSIILASPFLIIPPARLYSLFQWYIVYYWSISLFVLHVLQCPGGRNSSH